MPTRQRGRPPKLSEVEIREIKLSTVLSNIQLARLYRISEAHVSRIRSGAYVHSAQSQNSTKSITWIYVRVSVIRV